MKLQKFNCCICGKEEDRGRWIDSCSKELFKHQMCFTCNHWRTQHEQDLKDGPHSYAIVNGTHYRLMPHTDSFFKGFGGHKFVFEFFDGTIVECDNVWCQGRLTDEDTHAHWREIMPDNAKILQ